MIIAVKNAIAIPKAFAPKAFVPKFKSAVTKANEVAILGPRNGAIAIAPIITGILLSISPIAATIEDKITSAT